MGQDWERRGAQVRRAKGASGSRRIFSAGFKLRVLDSYRTDSDCRGNQRATARKYGIHRRQIQKWLQTENNLRRTAQTETGRTGEIHEPPPPSSLNSSTPPTSSTELERERETNTNTSSSWWCPPRQPDDPPPHHPPTPHPPPPTSSPSPTPSPTPSSHHNHTKTSSDSEEDDLTSDNSESSLYEQDHALDFTCAALSKRRFFSDAFKLQVVDAFYTDMEVKGNQRATARKYGVHRRQVQKWLEDRQSLRGATDTCLDLSNKKKRKCELNDSWETSNKKACYEEAVDVETTVQETALCLVKQRETPPLTPSSDMSHHQHETRLSLYRPYEDIVSQSSSECCQSCDRSLLHSWSPPSSRLFTPAGPYYGAIDASYVAECLSHDALYYTQTVHDVVMYAPLYS